MMRIALVINDRLCPAGLVGDVVTECGHDTIVFYPHEGDRLPTTTPKDWDGLIVFGGQMHAYEDENYPALADLANLIGDAHKAGLPFLGICLGAQLLSRALGEERLQMETFELGFQQMLKTPLGRRDPLLRDLDIPPVMQMHGDTFKVPEGGELLMSDENSVVQSIRVGNASYGFQCHFEVIKTDLEMWLNMVDEGYGHLLSPEQTERLRAARENTHSWLPAAQVFGAEVTRRWLGLVVGERLAA